MDGLIVRIAKYLEERGLVEDIDDFYESCTYLDIKDIEVAGTVKAVDLYLVLKGKEYLVSVALTGRLDGSVSWDPYDVQELSS